MIGETVVALHLGMKALGKLEDKFLGAVVRRWQSHRAHEFLDALAQTVAAQNAGPEAERKVDEAIDDAMSDDRKTEILFDAYRRVVLAASRNLGPRIIALLTAQLLADKRPPTSGEETILRVAETLTDGELVAMRDYLPDPDKELYSATPAGGFRQSLRKERIRIGARDWVSISTGPLNLVEHLGQWAVKAVQLGLVTQDIVEETHGSTGEYQDERDIEWFVEFIPETRRLSKLITRAVKTMEHTRDS